MEEWDALPGTKVKRLDLLDHFPRRATRSSYKGGGGSATMLLNVSDMVG